MKNNKGFSLVELMVAVAIVGILGSVAYPSYVSSVAKAHRSDGVDALLRFSQQMEKYYLVNDTYAGASVATLMNGTTSAEGRYELSFTNASGLGAPDLYGYMLKATPPVGADNNCGFLTLTSLGTKATEKGTVAACW